MRHYARRFAAGAVASLALAMPEPAAAAEPAVEEPKISGNVSGFYYAMRDQPDFGVGVASINRGPLRFEARYNYEARHATSAFVGWKFAGGDAVTYEITPIAGGLFGAAHAVIPGAEISVAYRSVDAYIEAEYVRDLHNQADSYFYTWNELGWRPVEWLRIGLVGQRTRTVQGDRDLQRGVFAQLNLRNFVLGVFAFNPDAASRYTIVSVGTSF
jgi:hypothetical protein